MYRPALQELRRLNSFNKSIQKAKHPLYRFIFLYRGCLSAHEEILMIMPRKLFFPFSKQRALSEIFNYPRKLVNSPILKGFQKDFLDNYC